MSASAPSPVLSRRMPAGRNDDRSSWQRRSTWQRSVGVLALATIAIGLANYLTTLIAVRLLPAAQFADFAAGQGLLLVLGTGSFAALPWAVARYLARSSDVHAAQQAMHFGLVGSVLQGIVLAPVALVVCWWLDGPLFGLAGGVATLFISVLAGPIGFLQGRQELTAIAAVRGIETVVRIAATMALIFLASRHAAVVLLAFPIGSAVALAYALRRGRAGFPMRPLGRRVALRLTRDAALLGAIQVLLAMLGALDTVYADAGHFTAQQGASYQAAALLGRIPLFFSAAISTAAYTEMAAARNEIDAGRQLRSAMRTYLWLAVPFLVGYLTVPRSLLDLVIPAEYTQTLPVLRVLCFAGVLVGVVNVVTTAHQARGGFRSCIWILAAAVVVQGAALFTLGRTGHLITFAVAASAICAIATAALLFDARRWLGDARTGVVLRRAVDAVSAHRVPVQPGVVVVVLASAGAFAVRQPVLWIALLMVVGAGAVLSAFRTRPAEALSTAAAAPAHTAPAHTAPAHTAPTLTRPHAVRSPRPRPTRVAAPVRPRPLPYARCSTTPHIEELVR